MAISAQLVKALRARTGAGILDSKHALEATNGEIDAAIKWLKEKGIAKAVQKAGRIAAEGLVYTAVAGNDAIMIEINAETDFVARNQQFQQLITTIGNGLLAVQYQEKTLLKTMIGQQSVAELIAAATITIGEKISFRRAQKITKTDQQNFGAYVHANGQIAALVVIEGGNEGVAKNVAMHLAAMNPSYLNQAAIPAAIVAEHAAEVAKELAPINKPEAIKVHMRKGKMQKKLAELTLVDQTFVMEKKTVQQYLKEHHAFEVAMLRYEVGEGITKESLDFAAEVAEQMK